jgi:hypothetical protein
VQACSTDVPSNQKVNKVKGLTYISLNVVAHDSKVTTSLGHLEQCDSNSAYPIFATLPMVLRQAIKLDAYSTASVTKDIVSQKLL